ncbi:hypothetical protein D9611_005729 [Ephemerocybe angulata]|uniref:F-box domain-containing protein n=1 Tax=Ephemerocybe angulata TaxID=980116 RepID=A0A8H5BHV5_9AGAR|nr:hypothetical protein D9611_005729 [Tulosesus angulatus]
MFTNILRDAQTTRKLLEAILESPNGKRSLSRLARTCRSLSEPALDILWRELDSIVPILGLFPPTVLRKARRPGLGLSRNPQESDWDTVLRYNERIRRVVYDETANNVAASVFPIIDEHRPCLYILPNLQELVWKAETPAGLDRCAMFLSPRLRSIQIELGANFKKDKINNFLYDMSSRTKLASFSFNSPTSLPDAFTELIARQDALERVVLGAPGALSSGVGRWASNLPNLKALQLDLTGRSPIAVEGFFDEIHPRSGASTPDSIASNDSGVFSSGEWDFAELRKSALRVTGGFPSKTSFAQLRRVQLTGEVGNIAVFFKHLSSPLTHIDLVIDDPPDNADWQDLSFLICELYGDTLQSLRISATSASRFADLVRSTSRSDPPSKRLSLEHLSDLNKLHRLEIDLPESIVFLPIDLDALADACPKLEVLRLCPLARFGSNSGGPRITLESLSLLTKRCKYLHTIGAVVNAVEASPATLLSPAFSSRSLLRLYLGGSWISDPLQVAVLLSHMAPRLETLRHFQERNRVGFNEANAKSWQAVTDILPHLQAVRKAEKSFAKPIPETTEKAVDATVQTVSRAIQCRPRMASTSVQCTPQLVDRGVHAVATSAEVAIDATQPTVDVGVEARPEMVSMEIDATSPPESEAEEDSDTMETMDIDEDEIEAQNRLVSIQILQQLYLLPSIIGFFTVFYRYLIEYPMAVPGMGYRRLTGLRRPAAVKERESVILNPKEASLSDFSVAEIPLDTLEAHT